MISINYRIMQEQYNILLDGERIGYTMLEHADTTMGVVFGIANLAEGIGYDFLKKYCQENAVQIVDDYPEDKLIATAIMIGLKLVDIEGKEVQGSGACISGMDSGDFEIYIYG